MNPADSETENTPFGPHLLLPRFVFCIAALLFICGNALRSQGKSQEFTEPQMSERDRRLNAIESTLAVNQVRIQIIQDDVRDLKYGVGALALMAASTLFTELVHGFRRTIKRDDAGSKDVP